MNMVRVNPADTIKILHKAGDAQDYNAGEVIFNQGDSGELVYALIAGEVEMFVDGKLIETIRPGDVFGEGALLHHDRQRTSSAIAKTNCHIVSLNQQRFLFAIQETPMFAFDLLRSYSDRFRKLKQKFVSLQEE